ncbi:class F sortase [Paenibacillus sp. 19GGS1-52]|uniref:class F sortase n=1 Tax=Paenibacillus sp. 19GGS1-52 TaxID=2758563 RepID=UPI001EFAF83B|nr:class F sortase [Paenibacillus sp. 19GGS1-52]
MKVSGNSSQIKPLQTLDHKIAAPDKSILLENNIKPALPKPFLPTSLVIPAIGVSAQIQPVAVLTNGQIGVPKETDLVGISYPGVLPGEQGNVILDGHVDSYTGPAVFFNLKKLKRGDAIIVSNNSGRKLTYLVESVEIFVTSEAPLKRIFGETKDPRLNLITCTGRYSRKKKEHEKRLIVFTKLEGEL